MGETLQAGAVTGGTAAVTPAKGKVLVFHVAKYLRVFIPHSLQEQNMISEKSSLSTHIVLGNLLIEKQIFVSKQISENYSVPPKHHANSRALELMHAERCS